jgi:hypothetical protein
VKHLATHVYATDPDNGPDHRGDYRCLCGLPQAHEVHRLPDTTEQQREHLRRAGVADEENE